MSGRPIIADFVALADGRAGAIGDLTTELTSIRGVSTCSLMVGSS